MNDREAIVEMTDEADRWMQKLEAERKAHEATRQAKLLAEAQLEYALARLVSPARAEIAEAIADFWEAEAERQRKQPVYSSPKFKREEMAYLWENWDGSVGDPPPRQRTWIEEPPIVWWHAHRRTR